MKPTTALTCMAVLKWALIGLLAWLLMTGLISGLRGLSADTRHTLDTRADVLEQSIHGSGMPS